MSAAHLCKETGVRQQNLSRWLTEACSLPLVAFDKTTVSEWTVEQNARVLADASTLTGEDLIARECESIKLAEFVRSCLALEEGGK